MKPAEQVDQEWEAAARLKRNQIRAGILLGLGLLIHFLLLQWGSYQKSYDAYTHIFFSSHWLNSWWNDFEPRWYTGFSIFTYPPFSHQLVALAAKGIGLEPAYKVMQTLALAGMTLGMYRYTRIWFSHSVALVAAVLCLYLPSLAMTVHLFGQYPNTVSLALVFNLLPYVDRWLKQGDWRDLLKGELLLIPAAFTSLFANFLGIFFFALPILVFHILYAWRERNLQRGGQLILLICLGIITLFGCLAPFFNYMQGHPFEQMQIPHASRDNVLLFNMDNYFMFYGLYGPYLLLLPAVLAYIFWQRKYWSFVFPILSLALFSTGGATELNRVLLGSLFDILTFDRFSFWITLLLIPLSAKMLLHGWELLRQYLPSRAWLYALGSLGFLIYFAFFALNALSFAWKPLPEKLDLEPIIAVLEQDRFQDFHYLTLGIGGNNLSALSTYLPNRSIDGNYNFARRIPELNQAPIALLDDTKYYGDPAIDSLAKLILDPNKYHLKTILLKDQYYTPLLKATSWIKIQDLDQGLEIWQSQLPVTPFPTDPVEKAPDWALWLWALPACASFLIYLLYLLGERTKQVWAL